MRRRPVSPHRLTVLATLVAALIGAILAIGVYVLVRDARLRDSLDRARSETEFDLRLARSLPDTLVDTGSEYTWISRQVLEELGVIPQRKQGFIVADGRRIDRDVGYALVRVAGSEAPSITVTSPMPARRRAKANALPDCPAPTIVTL